MVNILHSSKQLLLRKIIRNIRKIRVIRVPLENITMGYCIKTGVRLPDPEQYHDGLPVKEKNNDSDD